MKTLLCLFTSLLVSFGASFAVDKGPEDSRLPVPGVFGQRDLPPIHAPSVESVEQWMDECVKTDPICRWRKEVIKEGQRTLVCFDLRPYSGQPGHHIFVYQLSDKQTASLLFASIVWNPPSGEWFKWAYQKDSETLSVFTVPADPILSLKLTALWCF